MLDVMILLIGSRIGAVVMLGLLGLMKNGCRLEYSMGFWFCFGFISFRDLICDFLYEGGGFDTEWNDDSKMMYGNAVAHLFSLIGAAMCLIMIKKLIDGKDANGDNGAMGNGMQVMNTAPNANDANMTNRMNISQQPGDSQLGVVNNMQIK